MLTLDQAQGQLEHGWAGVTGIWLDSNASSVEQGSIKPLIEMLRDAQKFNDEQRAQAEYFVAKADEIPLEK